MPDLLLPSALPAAPWLPPGAVEAASAAEQLAPGALNPVTLATQLWEVSHTLTGLPWWLTIPCTALTLRAALLPLTVKAKGAAVNFLLMNQASVESRKIFAALSSEERAGTSAAQIRRSMYGYLRRQHATPSTWWYAANVAVQVRGGRRLGGAGWRPPGAPRATTQPPARAAHPPPPLAAQVNVFVALSIALRRMCDLAWPGLVTEGFWSLTDLTRCAVDWSTYTTPYGINGAFIPMLVLYAYIRCALAAGRQPGGCCA
jgi:hypothetical protein